MRVRIKAKKVNDKIKVISRNSQKGTKNTRAYWRMLKRLNGSNDYPIRIIDPRYNTRHNEDPKEISQVLREYWQGLGATNNHDDQVHKKQGESVNTLS